MSAGECAWGGSGRVLDGQGDTASGVTGAQVNAVLRERPFPSTRAPERRREFSALAPEHQRDPSSVLGRQHVPAGAGYVVAGPGRSGFAQRRLESWPRAVDVGTAVEKETDRLFPDPALDDVRGEVNYAGFHERPRDVLGLVRPLEWEARPRAREEVGSVASKLAYDGESVRLKAVFGEDPSRERLENDPLGRQRHRRGTLWLASV